jgi:hypothetical protein
MTGLDQPIMVEDGHDCLVAFPEALAMILDEHSRD